jgi:hypothetical protein
LGGAEAARAPRPGVRTTRAAAAAVHENGARYVSEVGPF